MDFLTPNKLRWVKNHSTGSSWRFSSQWDMSPQLFRGISQLTELRIPWSHRSAAQLLIYTEPKIGIYGRLIAKTMGIQSRHVIYDQPSIQSHSSAQLLHLKKHPGDTIPSPWNSSTLGRCFWPPGFQSQESWLTGQFVTHHHLMP